MDNPELDPYSLNRSYRKQSKSQPSHWSNALQDGEKLNKMMDSSVRRNSDERYAMYQSTALKSSKNRTNQRKTFEENSQSSASSSILRYGNRNQHSSDSVIRSSMQSVSGSRHQSPVWTSSGWTRKPTTEALRSVHATAPTAASPQTQSQGLWAARKSNAAARNGSHNVGVKGRNMHSTSRNSDNKLQPNKQASGQYDADGILIIEEEEEEEGFGMTLSEYVAQLHGRPGAAADQHVRSANRVANSRMHAGASALSNSPDPQHCNSGNTATSVWRYDRGWDVSEWNTVGSSTMTPPESPTAAWRGGPGVLLAASSNLLDLRPGTAIPTSSPTVHAMDVDPVTKQVDLGGLPTSLFRPASRHLQTRNSNSGSLRQSQQSSTTNNASDQFLSKTHSAYLNRKQPPTSILSPNTSPLSSPSSSASSTLVSPTAMANASTGAFHSVNLTGPKQANSPSSLCHSWQRGATATSSLGQSLTASPDAMWAHGSGAWKADKSEDSDTPREDLNESSVIRSRRLVQSARPSNMGNHEVEVDSSVWHANIERPPSRQKPPPEALHLFSPGRDHRMKARWNNLPARPHSANLVDCVRQVPQSFFRPDVDRQNSERPPTRQRPPPESLDLGHDAALADQSPTNSSPVNSSCRHIFTSDSESEAE